MVKKMSRGACDAPSGAEKTRDKSGSLLMKIGLALIAAALLLAVYNLWDDQRAGKSVDRVLDAMPELVKTAGVLDPSIVQEITYPVMCFILIWKCLRLMWTAKGTSGL